MKAASNIWCVGRNYRAHALELNNPVPEKPLIFLKAGTCIPASNKIELPSWTDDIHHECELAVRVNAQGEPTHLALALDLTARQAQAELKKKGEPWTLAKSFRGACPLSQLVAFPGFDEFENLIFHLSKNGQIVQKGSPRDMLFPLKTLLTHINRFYPVAEGDLILTGTPEGVGPIKKGDLLEGRIEGLAGAPLSVTWSVI